MDFEELMKEFEEECDAIARDCEEEGYPSCGSNYELRVEMLMQDQHFAPLFSEGH